MKKLLVAIIIILFLSGCVSANSKTVADLAPTENDLPKKSGQTYGVEREETVQSIEASLELESGFNLEKSPTSLGRLPGNTESGFYGITENGKLVLMLAIGKFESVEKAQENYNLMKENIKSQPTVSISGSFAPKISTTSTELSVRSDCSAVKNTLKMEYNQPDFSFLPEDQRPTVFETGPTEQHMQMMVCQKGLFMIGLMQPSSEDIETYMMPLANSILNKI